MAETRQTTRPAPAARQPRIAPPPAAVPDEPEDGPPPRPTQGDDVPIPALMQELDGWTLELKRAYAAYEALHTSLLSFKGLLPEGVRAKGLPIFEFTAPGPDGREPVKCVVDLKHIDPQFVEHVLVPIINVQAGRMIEAVEELSLRAAALVPRLRHRLGYVDPAGG